MKLIHANTITGFLLRLMALNFRFRPGLRSYMKDSGDRWINFSVGIKTENGSVSRAITFNNGRVDVTQGIPENTDVTLRFKDESALIEMLGITPNETLTLILNNRMILDGNLAILQIFNFYISLLLHGKHNRMLAKRRKNDIRERKRKYDMNNPALKTELESRRKERLQTTERDNGVKYLDDPYLSKYSIEAFPRLQAFLDIHFNVKPEICVERPLILTRWYRENGFEIQPDGTEWYPSMRQALSFKHLMKNKKPVIRKNDLVAGTTTASETCGVVIYPDAHGGMIWGELKSVENRLLNPYRVSEENINLLHREIFPYWIKRNFRGYVLDKYGYLQSQRIEERWVAYFVWKSVGISHTIPDFRAVLEKGTRGIISEIEDREKDRALTPDERKNLEAMKICLEGLCLYSSSLSGEARRLALIEDNPERRKELEKLAGICARVPAAPATTLDEAVNSIWITWVAMHMENTNTGLSLGRLDQLLQPFFEADIKKLKTPAEREEYTRYAIELTGCFFMRGTDHLPLVPDLGNYLFGGSSSDQAITLGGVTPEGEDAVNDMTYILLKVTEMLSIRDPNVNARFHPDKNSPSYLKRLCEVNLITAATPSMHNDLAVERSLASHGYPAEHIRDWAATGCVEPTLCGRHSGHTGSILMNMVAALEMALNNGRHPHLGDISGPQTGNIESGDFKSFDDFFSACVDQQRFLIENAVELNNRLAEAHEKMRPTPLLSSMTQGCVKKAKDVTSGGALYNSSGTSNIGLADITDSLMAVKKLVFESEDITYDRLKKALETDFRSDPGVKALIEKKVPRFGSGSAEAIAMADRYASEVHNIYAEKRNYRGGPYTSGFWSMSQHVAYGNLSGALPSGRPAGKAFTPGLTPHPGASRSFLDNIRDVARLNPVNMDNNIAFNVKLFPPGSEPRKKTVDTMYSYMNTYFNLGGMQMQFNVVTADLLKDAMANPENYKSLLVRISGYNAYFVTLNREMQIELIERAEFGM